MKTKLKNFILYSLAFTGIVSLFLSVNQTNQDNSRFEMVAPVSGNTVVYLFDNQTGEVWYINKTSKQKSE